jgi:hypothetical protein
MSTYDSPRKEADEPAIDQRRARWEQWTMTVCPNGVVNVRNDSYGADAGEHIYSVFLHDAQPVRCSCPHHVHRGARCKHIEAVADAPLVQAAATAARATPASSSAEAADARAEPASPATAVTDGGQPVEHSPADDASADSTAVVYRGERDPTRPVGEEVSVTAVRGGTRKRKTELLDERHDLANHSPAGFEFGYGGSGPHQLALAILAEHADEETALRHYGAFLDAVIADLPATGPTEWEIDGADVDAFLADHERVSEGRVADGSADDHGSKEG